MKNLSHYSTFHGREIVFNRSDGLQKLVDLDSIQNYIRHGLKFVETSQHHGPYVISFLLHGVHEFGDTSEIGQDRAFPLLGEPHERSVLAADVVLHLVDDFPRLGDVLDHVLGQPENVVNLFHAQSGAAGRTCQQQTARENAFDVHHDCRGSVVPTFNARARRRVNASGHWSGCNRTPSALTGRTTRRRYDGRTTIIIVIADAQVGKKLVGNKS